MQARGINKVPVTIHPWAAVDPPGRAHVHQTANACAEQPPPDAEEDRVLGTPPTSWTLLQLVWSRRQAHQCYVAVPSTQVREWHKGGVQLISVC